jgi:hypothetical protein
MVPASPVLGCLDGEKPAKMTRMPWSVRRRTRFVVVLAAASLSLALAACLQDFDTFVGTPPPVALIEAGGFQGTDGSTSPSPEAGACAAPATCLTPRSTCRSGCDTTQTSCLAACPADAGTKDAGKADAGNCIGNCHDAYNSCNGTCNFQCLTCAGACADGCL